MDFSKGVADHVQCKRRRLKSQRSTLQSPPVRAEFSRKSFPSDELQTASIVAVGTGGTGAHVQRVARSRTNRVMTRLLPELRHKKRPPRNSVE